MSTPIRILLGVAGLTVAVFLIACVWLVSWVIIEAVQRRRAQERDRRELRRMYEGSPR